jgi:Protein of unknown function (DUF3179)
MICNSGVGLTPSVGGQVHWFGVNGIANGLAVMTDEETSSHWDHITGEAFDGPLAGQRLKVWPILISTNQAELERDPGLPVLRQSYGWTLKRFIQSVPTYRVFSDRKWFPPGFRRSMSTPIDPRLPAFEQGLGVIVGDHARFYRFRDVPRQSVLLDRWLDRALTLDRDAGGTPRVRWDNEDQIPMQLLTRWYGFSFTYPECSIYRSDDRTPRSTT